MEIQINLQRLVRAKGWIRHRCCFEVNSDDSPQEKFVKLYDCLYSILVSSGDDNRHKCPRIIFQGKVIDVGDIDIYQYFWSGSSHINPQIAFFPSDIDCSGQSAFLTTRWYKVQMALRPLRELLRPIIKQYDLELLHASVYPGNKIKSEKRSILVEMWNGKKPSASDWVVLSKGIYRRIDRLFKFGNCSSPEMWNRYMTCIQCSINPILLQRAWARAILAIPGQYNNSDGKLPIKYPPPHSLKDDPSLQQLYHFFRVHSGLKRMVGGTMARYVPAPPLICTDADDNSQSEASSAHS